MERIKPNQTQKPRHSKETKKKTPAERTEYVHQPVGFPGEPNLGEKDPDKAGKFDLKKPVKGQFLLGGKCANQRPVDPKHPGGGINYKGEVQFPEKRPKEGEGLMEVHSCKWTSDFVERRGRGAG